MKKKILIVDDLHPYFKEEAIKLGYEINDQPLFTREQTLAIIGEYDGLAIRTKFQVDKEIIDHAHKLKFIARAGAGMDNIDEEYSRSKQIYCLNAPEGNRDAVAEHAIAMLLALTNNLFKGDKEIRNGVWDRESNRGWEIKGKTVGIIGYGNTGKSFARKISGFDVTVLAYDKYHIRFGDEFATEVSMEEIVKRVDILSLHLPLTSETRAMVDNEYLLHFRKPIFFLNTSRGEIVRTQAMLNAVNTGKILGAGLDVLEVEKFPELNEQSWFNALQNEGKLILSPHIAGWTFESYRRISEVLIEKLKNLHF
ncbi:MAG TPA: NAD(P)-dependent oxidoreductase [Sphingobacteriaceae bacterium]|nr:NAD(P)-dependent oxidoreductase [Sphingobacteriaceae bacterium]